MSSFISKANPHWDNGDYENREKWPKGEWGLEPDYYTGEAFGFPFEVLRMPPGHLCGYVGVPEDHPLYKSEGEELTVHGGVTYTSQGDKTWWFGFDAGHSRDLMLSIPDRSGTYRNLAYMVKECVDLARQLAERNDDHLRRAFAGFVVSYKGLTLPPPSFENFKANTSTSDLWLSIAKAITEWSPSDAS